MRALDRFRFQLTTELRARAREMGLTPHLAKFRRITQRLTGNDGYEAHFDRALMSSIRPGDVVWDVGANVGLYTTRFAESAGAEGKVIAFEPVPESHAKLKECAVGKPTIDVRQLALGSEVATLTMNLASDPTAVSNSLVESYMQDGGTIEVGVTTGDRLVEEGTPLPNVLKIDVEGYEEHVVQGLLTTLANPACRALFVEVHFAVLDGMGARQAPARIHDTLEKKGFDVSWVDASHLAATRPG